MEHMTAKVSCFARAYHYKNNTTWIFKDEYAADILGRFEYDSISANMVEGINFFAPDFEGDKEQALELIVNNQLAPSVLGRSAFNERHFWKEYRSGIKQYVLFAAGYDTFSYRNTCGDLSIFEMDLPRMIEDKLAREAGSGLHKPENCRMIPCDLSDEGWKGLLAENGFLPEKKSYGSLLGISYYLSKEAFEKMLGNISEVFAVGSTISFDYPASEGSDETVRNEKLAKAAKEEMKAKYSYAELKKLLDKYGFEICEHLNSEEMTEEYFREYNNKTAKQMSAPKGVDYIFAVKR
ncbi:MAG: class I SAM-dependent methyltransferase [Acetatifactor sp.]